MGCLLPLVQVRSSAATVVNEKAKNKKLFAKSGTTKLIETNPTSTLAYSWNALSSPFLATAQQNVHFLAKTFACYLPMAKMNGGNMRRLNVEFDVSSSFGYGFY